MTMSNAVGLRESYAKSNHAVRFGAAFAVGLSCLFAGVTGVAAQEPYPNHTIKIVIPFAAGGPIDSVGRPVAEVMSKDFGVPVVIENKPGANGIVAAGGVTRSAPDGYTLLLTTGSHTANPSVVKDLPYDPIKDFTPVSLLAEAPYGQVLVVRNSLPVKSVADLIALAKKEPGKILFGHAGVGNVTHITGEMFQHAAGVTFQPVPYRGTPLIITDLIGGHVDVGFVLTSAAVPLIKDGKIRALANTGTKRAPALPDVPTFTEIGLPGVVMTGFFGFLLPGKAPQEIVDKLAKEAAKAVHQPEVVRAFTLNDLVPVGSTPAEFKAYLEKDLAYQRELTQRIGFKPIAIQ
ncbi:Bug family tripartite tricarboxylate transporter substrate binding protein [Aquabacter spiritensis]|uniref:Tripartite-type tricarboxylate transporter receptor subunit TctC n=1 Tax=Aquabacter spiritensis TaxID=933073 RepID=A0A4R3LZN9_9HYPH|nr:tripartite tricarboxylate transporter substrate binding protein [Aquabacter spiritensis]TCT04247.1 tripartite-type tricarboxylate transporter receptor subunit TctC [Aquabacter spiritensis]